MATVLKDVLTFDDVVILPMKSPVEPSEVSITATIGNIKISIPLMGAPMDMVTNEVMAEHLARAGAIGILHRNNSIEQQVEMANKVKSADARSIEEIYITKEWREPPAILDRDREVVYIVPENESEYWLDKLKGVYRLVKLGTTPTIGFDGRLAVGAAVSPFDEKRIYKLDKIADLLVVDVAHAHNENIIKTLRNISPNLSKPLIIGNIGTYKAAEEYVTRVSNIAGFRVGISSGSICTTGEVTGAAAPTLYAVIEVARALKTYGLHGKIPVIADGGIREAADAAKALIAGASLVMTGRYIASANESASPILYIGGKQYKLYRGMGSYSALKARHAMDRYARRTKNVVEGVEGLVPVSGSLYSILANFVETLKAALGYAGASSIKEAWEKSVLGKITPQGKKEVKPHDLLL